jgi:cystathionine beta-lyase
MNFNFDEIINRRNTYSIKHDPLSRGKPGDVLPLWVADMDFRAPPCVRDIIVSRAEHGIFGYSDANESYFNALRNWYNSRFGWDFKNEWVVFSQGVVNALYIAIQAFTSPGDRVVIQEPVYGPFSSVINGTGRNLLVNELIYEDGRYSIDFDDFEKKIKEAKLFILCSPHNPVGRVWSIDELRQMGEICRRYGVIVMADEIHQDFVYPGSRHQVFTKIDESFSDFTITCTAPSKTFNLAGLMHANNFISSELLRNKFKKVQSGFGLGLPSLMGLAACEAAYSRRSMAGCSY